MPHNFFPFHVLRGVFGIFPHLQNFVFESNNLGVALVDLLPLLCQLIDWFEGLVKEHKAMSEVRSSELETRLLLSGDLVEGDTAVSTPREVRAFYALEEVCGLDADTLDRFKDRFQFPKRVRICLPNKEDQAYHFFPGEV